MRCAFLILLSSALFAVEVGAQASVDEAYADSLYENYKNKKALKAYKQILASDANNLNALWHLSLLYSRLGERLKKEDQKKEYFSKAEDRARQALKVNATNSQSNFAMAVAIGQMARVGDIEAKMAAASDIKKYVDRAVQEDSTNAGAWFVLGMWNYEISNLSAVEETIANLISGIPNGASTDKAVQNIRKAIDLHPSFILYYHGLACAYKALGKKNQAIKACRTGLKKPIKTRGDSDTKRKCRDLIDELNDN